LNFASYNYLGFAQAEGPCADAVEKAIDEYGVSSSSTRAMNGFYFTHIIRQTLFCGIETIRPNKPSLLGTQPIHLELEKTVAEFVGKPAALLTAMGFATNSTNLPTLIGKSGLIISDELNHSSLVTGAKNSGAHIRVFKHNGFLSFSSISVTYSLNSSFSTFLGVFIDVEDLEECLKEAITQGMPRTHRPWKKILVVVEGLYSMEGNICNLPAIVALKEKYKVSFSLLVIFPLGT